MRAGSRSNSPAPKPRKPKTKPVTARVMATGMPSISMTKNEAMQPRTRISLSGMRDLVIGLGRRRRCADQRREGAQPGREALDEQESEAQRHQPLQQPAIA